MDTQEIYEHLSSNWHFCVFSGNKGSVSLNRKILFLQPAGTNMKRILIVDDEKDIVHLFTLILKDNGYLVDTYTDAIVALVEFKANYYDMIILDYRMEGLNGLEFYQKIRAVDKSARAMLLTAAHEQLELDENYKWFLRVVGKPISGNALLKEVAIVLKQTNSLPDILTR
jgi:DNA-binding response OmpR family regulator